MVTLLSAFVLTLGASVAPAAPAEEPVVAALDAGTALCLPSAPAEMARGGGDLPDPTAQAYCEADCEDGSKKSCSGSSCSAVDQNCPSVQGYAECDGNYWFCPDTCEPPSCGPAQCHQQCNCPGGISICDSIIECTCHCEYM